MMPITRQQWSEEHIWCMNPGHHIRLPRDVQIIDGELLWLETHEITAGSARAKAMREPATWLRLCCKCHNDRPWDRVGPDDINGVIEQLTWKLTFDPHHYDLAKVLELKHWGPRAITQAEVVERMAVLAITHAEVDAELRRRVG